MTTAAPKPRITALGRARAFDSERRPAAQVISELARASGIDLSGARVRAGFVRGHLLELVLGVPGGSGSEAERAATEQALRWLLGEDTFEHWVGGVSVTPAPRRGPLRVLGQPPSGDWSLEELPGAVDGAIASLLAGLPERPYVERPPAADWVLFELEPVPQPDYAELDDLLVATTRAPELVKSLLRGESFFSGRFSRAGELFVYLKCALHAADAEARLSERTRIEDAVTDALTGARLGAVIGNGLGLRYAYLILSLVDPERALDALCAAARGAGAPRESWVLFCDAELSGHWLALWPDSPEPYLEG